MSRAGTDLTPSLVRLGGDAHELERHLLRNFRKYAPRGDVPVDSVWNWLALGQHHGLPTRLLDWTYSPYVALHFVTANLDRYDEDGVVWCADYVRAHLRAPDKLRRPLEEEGANLFNTEMLDRAAPDLARFDDLGDEDFLVFVEPPSFDERIVNQYALFALPPSPTLSPAEGLAARPELARRMCVPGGRRWGLRASESKRGAGWRSRTGPAAPGRPPAVPEPPLPRLASSGRPTGLASASCGGRARRARAGSRPSRLGATLPVLGP